jgi:hypothetical protein
MINTSLHRVLNALAFANVGNLSEFQLLLEQLDNPGPSLPFVHSIVTPRSSLDPHKASPIATNSYRHLAKP